MIVLLLVCLGAMGVGASDFTEMGPYQQISENFGVDMPESTGCTGRICSLKVTVTKPVVNLPNAAEEERKPPFPLVFMFNGFQVIAHSRWSESPWLLRIFERC